ncbi:MAG TPA: glycerol-3-phosphate acyltransferase [Chloroflexia bacterium]|nr:glycerol-3-phosphate acyltransferase [Chloroflexia bacterium]
MMALYFILAIVVSYLIGALPIGAMVAASRKIDIAKHGSGKMGSTNVLRTVGRRAAALVLLGDVAKGAVAVLLVRLLAPLFISGDGRFEVVGFSMSLLTIASLLASAGAVLGHVMSLYLRIVYGQWHGGRGVATALGALLVVNPVVVLVAVGVGVPVIVVSRYVSLGSILGALAGSLAVILLVAFGQMDVLSLLFVVIGMFVVIAHRDNIQRLLNGTERKLGERAKT